MATVARVLEVSRGDHNGVDVLACVELFVVAGGFDRGAADLLHVSNGFIAPQAPDIGDGDILEVLPGSVDLKRGNQRLLHTIPGTDDADADAVVGSWDGGVAGGGAGGGRGGGRGGSAELQEVAAGLG